jgi:hypothetical protein
MKRNKGFAIVELVLILVIVGIIAFVAWRVIEASGDAQTAQNQVPQSTVDPEDAATPAVTNTSDLTKLENELNNQKLDDSTSTDLDTQTTF